MKRWYPVASYSNTYSIKLDKTDFDSKLTSLSTAYKNATQSMETQSIELKNAKQNLTNVEKRKNVELEKGIQTSTQVNKQFKEELALARQKVRLQTTQNNAHKQNISNIKASIANTKELQAGESKLAQAVRESVNQQNRSTVAFKEKVGIITKSEIVLRRYADLTRQVVLAERNGTISAKEAIRARTNLNKARKAELAGLKETVAYRNTAVNGLVRHIRKIESLVIAFYGLKKSYDYTLGLGHEFNKMMESEQIGIALSIAQKLKDVDVTGKQVSALEKWAYANKLAREEMEKVREINVYTPHTLGQTVQLYKVISGQVRSANGDVEDALAITKQLSILAQAGNVEFKSMLKTVDQLFSGKMKASDMQIALQNIVGLTQEGTREALRQGNVLEYVREKLKGVEIASVDVAKTWGGVTSNFQNAWTDIFATLQKPMFDAFKEELKDISIVLIEDKEEIIGTFQDIGTGIKTAYSYLDELVVAFVAYKLATSTAGISTLALAKNVTILQTSLGRAIISARALALAQRALLAIFSPTNIAIGALTVAYSLYSNAQEEAEEHEKSLEKAMRQTKETIEQLDVAIVKLSKRRLGDAIKKDYEEISKLKNTIGSRESFIRLNVLKEGEEINDRELEILKAKLAELVKQKDEHRAQLKLYNKRLNSEKDSKNQIGFMVNAMGEFDTETYKALLTANKLSKSLTDSVSALNIVKRETSVLHGKMTANEKKVYDAQDKVNEATKYRLKLVKQLNDIGSAEVGDSAKIDALNKQRALIGKALSDETKAKNELEKAGNGINLEGINIIDRELQLEIDKSELLDKQNKDKDATYNAEVKRAKADYATAVFKINADKTGLSDADKKLEKAEALSTMELAIQSAKESQVKTDTKAGKASDKLTKNMDSLYEKYLEITNQGSLLEAFKIEQLVDEFREAGYEASKLAEITEALKQKDIDAFDKKFALEAPTLVDEVFNPYLNLIESQKEYIKNIELAGGKKAKIDKINAKQTELQLKGYAGIANGMQGMFKEGTKGYEALGKVQKVLQVAEMAWFLKEQILQSISTATTLASVATETSAVLASEGIKSTAKGITATIQQATEGDPYTAWARMIAMATTVASLGIAMAGIAGGSGGGMTDEQETAFGGQDVGDYTDESLSNIVDAFEDTQYPMLEVTNKMYKHIRNMDNNFYSIARAIAGTTGATGIDITGGSFEGGIYDANTWSSKTTELLGAGLIFEEQTLQAMTDMETLYVQGYESIKTVKDYWWKTSITYATKLFDLPESALNDFASAFASGYETVLSAGVLLGMDEVNLAELLSEATIKLGDDEGKINLEGLDQAGVADALSSIFSTAFSQVISEVEVFDTLLDRYETGVEDQLETILRIGLEFDQASHVFDLLGKDFVTVVSDFTSQMQVLDIVKSVGGLTEFNDAMGSFMSNFYTDAEQLGFLTKSMEVAFSTLDGLDDGISLVMPNTNDEFRALLETMDTTTEEGAYLYGQVLLLADGFNEMTQASDSLGDSLSDVVNDIADIYTGDLSYFTLQQKADYASGAFAIARASDEDLDVVALAKLNAEQALATSRTKAEYIPALEGYVNAVADIIADSTNSDIIAELILLKNEIVKLQEVTTDATIFGT